MKLEDHKLYEEKLNQLAESKDISLEEKKELLNILSKSDDEVLKVVIKESYPGKTDDLKLFASRKMNIDAYTEIIKFSNIDSDKIDGLAKLHGKKIFSHHINSVIERYPQYKERLNQKVNYIHSTQEIYFEELGILVAEENFPEFHYFQKAKTYANRFGFDFLNQKMFDNIIRSMPGEDTENKKAFVNELLDIGTHILFYGKDKAINTGSYNDSKIFEHSIENSINSHSIKIRTVRTKTD